MKSNTKRFGQNFLNSSEIADRIVENLGDINHKKILEIGPGKGILTEKLIKKGAIVDAIEIDKYLAENLSKTYPELNVLYGDAVKVKWPEFSYFISNLPYSAAAPILIKLIKYQLKNMEEAVVMVQKEMATRIMATSGKNYSSLSIAFNSQTITKKLFDVKKGAFTPPPKVDSTVLKIIPKENRNEKFWEVEKIIRKLFSTRRKMIKNIIKSLGVDYSGEYAIKRPEEIPPDKIIEFALELKNIIQVQDNE